MSAGVRRALVGLLAAALVVGCSPGQPRTSGPQPDAPAAGSVPSPRGSATGSGAPTDSMTWSADAISATSAPSSSPANPTSQPGQSPEPGRPAEPGRPHTANLAPPPPGGPSGIPGPAGGVTLGDIRIANDTAADGVLHVLADAVRAGNRDVFLRPFPSAMTSRLGQWFDNTRALGVAAAGFVRTAGYFAPRRDTPTAFTRTIILGVRTPYDDADSMPGIAYTVTMAKAQGRWQIIDWAPSYVEDPMLCGCRLQVEHRGNVAVVSAGTPALDGWPRIILDRAGEGTGWAPARMGGSGLRAPSGHVFFLADRPYRWFLSNASGPEESNATISLVDGAGSQPGQLFSTQSRIVLMLTDGAGRIAPHSPIGMLYAWDVIAHESAHQLMNENSQLYYGSGDPISTWVVEGIAVAVEVLHRRDHPETDDIGYYLRDDPRNIDRDWLGSHLTGNLPTRAQLYTTPDTERNNWYGLSGSVFLFLAAQYGFPAMMNVARLVYADNDRTPFDYVPDAAGTGYLSRSAAMSAWRIWFTGNYLG